MDDQTIYCTGYRPASAKEVQGVARALAAQRRKAAHAERLYKVARELLAELEVERQHEIDYGDRHEGRVCDMDSTIAKARALLRDIDGEGEA